MGLGFLVFASSVQAQVLVVRATGPSATRFRTGSALPNNGSVALKPGDVLVLLDEQSSWTLRGPGTMPVRARQQRIAAPRLVSVNERRARIGAVRTPDADAQTRPNLWMIDVAQPGTTCVVDATAPLFWRADGKAAGKTVITAPGGATAEIDWAAGQTSAAWPKALPVETGAAYRVADNSLTLKLLAPAPDSVADAGKALIASGCSVQLNLLVSQMAAAGNAPGS